MQMNWVKQTCHSLEDVLLRSFEGHRAVVGFTSTAATAPDLTFIISEGNTANCDTLHSQWWVFPWCLALPPQCVFSFHWWLHSIPAVSGSHSWPLLEKIASSLSQLASWGRGSLFFSHFRALSFVTSPYFPYLTIALQCCTFLIAVSVWLQIDEYILKTVSEYSKLSSGKQKLISSTSDNRPNGLLQNLQMEDQWNTTYPYRTLVGEFHHEEKPNYKKWTEQFHGLFHHPLIYLAFSSGSKVRIWDFVGKFVFMVWRWLPDTSPTPAY